MARESLSAIAVLRELTEAASRFVDKAPRQKRLEAERQTLLDVITRAQLVLSVSSRKGDEETLSEVTASASPVEHYAGEDSPAKRTIPPLSRRPSKKTSR